MTPVVGQLRDIRTDQAMEKLKVFLTKETKTGWAFLREGPTGLFL